MFNLVRFILLVSIITLAVTASGEDYYITDCGILYDGVELNCLMIDTYNHDDYQLLSYPDTLKAGDTLFVSGWVDTGSLSFCMQGDILYVSRVSSCPDPTYLEDCGIISKSEDSCLLFNMVNGKSYELIGLSYNPPLPGETLYVEGQVEYDCCHQCSESDGCLLVEMSYPCKYTKPVEAAGEISLYYCTILNTFNGMRYELYGDYSPFSGGDSVYVYAHYFIAPSICMIGPIIEIDSIFAFVMTGLNESQFGGSYQFHLGDNHPNPFNMSTIIEYSLGKRSYITLTIHDISGRMVKTLVDKTVDAGEYKVCWDGSDESGEKVSTGVYFYQIKTDEFVESKKMILLK